MLINAGASADLQVDGGINFNHKKAVDCGANFYYRFRSLKGAISSDKNYRSAAEEASAGSWWQTIGKDSSGEMGHLFEPR